MSEEGDSNEQEVGNDDDLVEPNKAKHKIIRVLTVVAYTLSVSMAAILLSIYYVFMWDGHPTLARKDSSHSLRTQHQQVYLPHQPQLQHETEDHLNNDDLPNATKMTVTAPPMQVDQLHYNQDIGTEENVLVDVPFEPTAIPVVEAKTEALSVSTPNTLIIDEDDNIEDAEWSMNVNNTYTHLVEIAKRSPMMKKLISTSIAD